MKLSFRQGLISFQQDINGSPQFLKTSSTPGYVALNVSPTPTLATFAHKQSNYLQSFDQASAISWGPLTPGVDNYLYWDIDLLNANVTPGISLLEPIVSVNEPTYYINDLHWFDLNTNTMKVWSAQGEKWVVRIRVFAGKVTNGNINQIVSKPFGTQVGIVEDNISGFIILDAHLKPLRTSTGEFLTTQTYVRIKNTSGTSGILAKPVNAFVPVRAGENIPAMSIVYLSGEDEVSLASSDPMDITEKMPVGIIQHSLAVNEIGDLIQNGELSYDQWDWSDYIGKPLFVNSYGQLTPNRPAGLLSYRVAVVKSRSTIIFSIDAETQPQVYQADASQMIINGVLPLSVTTAVNSLGEMISNISIVNATDLSPGAMSPAHVIKLNSFDPRFNTIEGNITALIASKANVAHTHSAADILDLSAILSTKMNANKNFDDRYAPININFDSRYATTNHTHVITNINGLQIALDSKMNRVGSLLAFSSIWEGVDRSGASDISSGSSLSSVLDGKAQSIHVHAIDDISDLRSELSNRAFINHTHTISQITNLQNLLDGKLSLNTSGQILTELVSMEGTPTINTHLINKGYLDVRLSGIANQSTSAALANLTDVSITENSLDGGQEILGPFVLAYDNDLSIWAPRILAIDDLLDVFTFNGNYDGDHISLTWNQNANRWEPKDLSIFDHNDVRKNFTLDNNNETVELVPEDYDVLAYDFAGGYFRPARISLEHLFDVAPYPANIEGENGNTIVFDKVQNTWNRKKLHINELDGVAILTPANGDLLSWNELDGQWQPFQLPQLPSFTNGEIEPADPILGDRWFVPTTSSLFTRINDGTDDIWFAS